MPAPVTFKRPELVDVAFRPGSKKKCPPLAGWRTDAPESLPFCFTCRATINVGTAYVVAYPVYVLCLAHGDPEGRLR
jgi:hypothetical protein